MRFFARTVTLAAAMLLAQQAHAISRAIAVDAWSMSPYTGHGYTDGLWHTQGSTFTDYFSFDLNRESTGKIVFSNYGRPDLATVNFTYLALYDRKNGAMLMSHTETTYLTEFDFRFFGMESGSYVIELQGAVEPIKYYDETWTNGPGSYHIVSKSEHLSWNIDRNFSAYVMSPAPEAGDLAMTAMGLFAVGVLIKHRKKMRRGK